MIVADTGAVTALLDADDRHHRTLRNAYRAHPDTWVLPSAILPEVDYLTLTRLGPRVEQAFLDDVAAGAFVVDWGDHRDLARARDINRRYRALEIGPVDAVVMAIAERRRAEAIATLDLHHCAAVTLKGVPKLYPRDLQICRSIRLTRPGRSLREASSRRSRLLDLSASGNLTANSWGMGKARPAGGLSSNPREFLIPRGQRTLAPAVEYPVIRVSKQADSHQRAHPHRAPRRTPTHATAQIAFHNNGLEAMPLTSQNGSYE